MSRRSLLVTAGALALAPAAAAQTLPDNDLAWLRLLLGTELLGGDFYGTALAAKKLRSKQLKDALAAERQHYRVVAGLLAGSGATPATADDVEFAYPRGAFASTRSIAKLAVALESTFVGAYLGAVAAVQSASLKAALAPIAVAQGQHRAVFVQQLGGYPLRPAIPAPLTLDRASNLLDAYTA